MKTLAITQLFVCLTFLSYCQLQTFSLSVEKFKTTDNFVLNINNPSATKLMFSIKDKSGKPYFQENYMFLEKIKKVLFLGSLPPGDYILEALNGEETRSTNIKIEGIDKTVHPENGKALIVGFSKVKADNSIDIVIQNKLDKVVSVKVFKEKSLMSTEDINQSDEIVKRILKLSKQEKGDYTVKVGTKENLYQYKFSL
jgi:hypothetical protein